MKNHFKNQIYLPSFPLTNQPSHCRRQTYKTRIRDETFASPCSKSKFSKRKKENETKSEEEEEEKTREKRKIFGRRQNREKEEEEEERWTWEEDEEDERFAGGEDKEMAGGRNLLANRRWRGWEEPSREEKVGLRSNEKI